MYDEIPDMSEPVYVPNMDEKAERKLRSGVKKICDSIGIDAAMEIAVELALACEEEIRADPTHPSNEILDEYYAEQRRKERGWE